MLKEANSILSLFRTESLPQSQRLAAMRTREDRRQERDDRGCEEPAAEQNAECVEDHANLHLRFSDEVASQQEQPGREGDGDQSVRIGRRRAELRIHKEPGRQMHAV